MCAVLLGRLTPCLIVLHPFRREALCVDPSRPIIDVHIHLRSSIMVGWFGRPSYPISTCVADATAHADGCPHNQVQSWKILTSDDMVGKLTIIDKFKLTKNETT